VVTNLRQKICWEVKHAGNNGNKRWEVKHVGNNGNKRCVFLSNQIFSYAQALGNKLLTIYLNDHDFLLLGSIYC